MVDKSKFSARHFVGVFGLTQWLVVIISRIENGVGIALYEGNVIGLVESSLATQAFAVDPNRNVSIFGVTVIRVMTRCTRYVFIPRQDGGQKIISDRG